MRFWKIEIGFQLKDNDIFQPYLQLNFENWNWFPTIFEIKFEDKIGSGNKSLSCWMNLIEQVVYSGGDRCLAPEGMLVVRCRCGVNPAKTFIPTQPCYTFLDISEMTIDCRKNGPGRAAFGDVLTDEKEKRKSAQKLLPQTLTGLRTGSGYTRFGPRV